MSTAQLIITIIGTVNVLFTGGLLGVWLRHRQGMRSLENEDKKDVRDHYAEELERVVERQRKCEERERQLQLRVVELENDVLGLIRIITQASADKVLMLDNAASEMIQDMASRIKEHHRIGS